MKNKSTYCPLLWNHLNTHPDGGVSFCCISKYDDNKNRPVTDGKIYNLNNDSIHDIMNSGSYKRARIQMLNGEMPDACMRCYNEEAAGVSSRREYKLRVLNLTENDARAITNEDGSLDNVPLEFVELRLGNTCNLQCRTCDSSSSSKWRREYEELDKVLSFNLHNNFVTPVEAYDWVDDDEFWNDLTSYFNTLERFSINGGEPTLIKKQFRFLQRLLEMNRTDFFLRYNINVTNLDETMIDIWRKFDRVQLSLSIDDIGKRNEYIRWPTKWDTVIKNLDRLSQEKFELNITHTISFMNYYSVPEYYKFFKDNYPSITIIPNFVEKPYYLSPLVLPIELRQRTNEMIHTIFPDDEYTASRFINVYSGQQSPLWNQAVEFTQKRDAQQGINISDYLPEFKGYI